MHRDPDKVIEMAIAGNPPAEIRRVTKYPKGYIYNTLSNARRRGEDIPRFANNGGPGTDLCRVSVPRVLLCRLEAPARKRGLNVRELAQQLLERIVVDDLFNAVLDDGGCDD